MEYILCFFVVEFCYGEIGWDYWEFNFEVIKEVVDFKYIVFDVLILFFVYEDFWVFLVVLEVYVCCVYCVYVLKKIEYYIDEIEMLFFVFWDFVLCKIGQIEFGLFLQFVVLFFLVMLVDNIFKCIYFISDMFYFERKI